MNGDGEADLAVILMGINDNEADLIFKQLSAAASIPFPEEDPAAAFQ